LRKGKLLFPHETPQVLYQEVAVKLVAKTLDLAHLTLYYKREMKIRKSVATEERVELPEAPELEAPKVRLELEKAQATLAAKMRALRELEAAKVEAGDVAKLAQRREKLMREIDQAKFTVSKLREALTVAEEKDRVAMRAHEEKVREALRPAVAEAVDGLKAKAAEFGTAYRSLLAIARKLPKVDRIAGPSLALAVCAILEEHDLGNPQGPWDIEAERLRRWSGVGEVSLEAEAKALKTYLVGGERQ